MYCRWPSDVCSREASGGGGDGGAGAGGGGSGGIVVLVLLVLVLVVAVVYEDMSSLAFWVSQANPWVFLFFPTHIVLSHDTGGPAASTKQRRTAGLKTCSRCSLPRPTTEVVSFGYFFSLCLSLANR